MSFWEKLLWGERGRKSKKNLPDSPQLRTPIQPEVLSPISTPKSAQPSPSIAIPVTPVSGLPFEEGNMSNHRQLQIPETINKHIRRAWIAAVISASVTLLLVFLSIGGVKILEGINALSILDVLILSGLALGVYKRSRVCAIILLAYGIFNEIYMVSEGHKPSPLRLIFMYYYFRGVLATFAYYRLNPSQKTFTMPPPPPEPTLLVRNSWFIYLGQQVKGPFSIDQLKALLSVGTICNDTKCCAEGTQDWQPISALFL